MDTSAIKLRYTVHLNIKLVNFLFKLDNEQFEDDETEFLEIKNDLKVAKEYQYK